MKLTFKKGSCHICTNWTPLRGCNHYGPQDYDLNKDIINDIVTAIHNNNSIVETTDFLQGITAALIYLRQNNLLTTKNK